MARVNTERTSDVVRRFVVTDYIEPARRRGATSVAVNVGDVHRALGLQGRVPLVCSALRGKKFLEENKLRLVEQTGPPSGLSTTVTLTYEFEAPPQGEGKVSRFGPFLRLHGIAREVFRELGGAEEFIRAERRSWEKTSEGEPRP
jgi:hypothetical protein